MCMTPQVCDAYAETILISSRIAQLVDELADLQASLHRRLAECGAEGRSAVDAARRAGTCSHLDVTTTEPLDSAEVELRAGVVSGAGMFGDGI